MAKRNLQLSSLHLRPYLNWYPRSYPHTRSCRPYYGVRNRLYPDCTVDGISTPRSCLRWSTCCCHCSRLGKTSRLRYLCMDRHHRRYRRCRRPKFRNSPCGTYPPRSRRRLLRGDRHSFHRRHVLCPPTWFSDLGLHHVPLDR